MPEPPCRVRVDWSATAHRIRSFRLDRGLTQAELGYRIGAPHTNISDFERGKRQPGIEIMWSLAAALRTQPALLVVLETPGG